ncbi:hypothetical protein PAMC26577_02500 [Caballeronia sordidicola]|uniref:Uncharacterized protein n=1 Tax=Caballeronia sordidicola TaxID=196367 RepID=A0A242N630_CABSO|nr:hypothetical protein PAMC26577_02500 [Caballeronia sordidicola]
MKLVFDHGILISEVGFSRPRGLEKGWEIDRPPSTTSPWPWT